MKELLTGIATRQWLEERVAASQRFVLVAPFITRSGLQPVFARLKSARKFRLTIITALDFQAALSGALDLDAINELMTNYKRRGPVSVQVVEAPRLHAKIMIADDHHAIVGSANVTSGGLGGNVEFCVPFRGPSQTRLVQQAVDSIFRVPLTPAKFKAFKSVVDKYASRVQKLIRQHNPATLWAFPGFKRTNGRPGWYLHAVQEVLALVEEGGNRAAALQLLAEQALRKLKEEQTSHAIPPEDRLNSLEYLGLFRGGSRFALSDLGRAVLKDKSADVLTPILLAHHPELGQILQEIRAKPGHTYVSLAQSLSTVREQVERPVRWLRSLGLVKAQGHELTFEATPRGVKTGLDWAK